ncbi:MAG: OmpA family protein [Chitinophagaceae bacterium]
MKAGPLAYPRFCLLYLLIGFVVFIGNACTAQNLVPNGAFNDINTCSEFQLRCGFAAWFNVKSPDDNGFFLTRDAADSYKKYLKLQVASSKSPARQYWQTMLLCPLDSGRQYKISFEINAPTGGPNLYDIGLYFRDDFLHTYTDTLMQPADYIDFLDASTVKIKNGWFRIEKTIMATQHKKVMIAGNFSATSNVAIMQQRNPPATEIILYADNFKISPVDKNACAGTKELQDSLYALRSRHQPRQQRSFAAAAPVLVTLPERVDTILIKDIQFGFDSDKLLSPAILDEYKSLFSTVGIKKILVTGFTDDAGTPAYNHTLSLRRANEIARLLHEKFSLPLSIIQTEGKGISKKYAENTQNRRVELYVYH